MSYRAYGRLLKVHAVLVHYGVTKWAISPKWQWLNWINPLIWSSFSQPKLSRAQALRIAFEELGPLFVKLGQVLSTRPDLLPEDFAQELARLQDQVPPFSGEEAKFLIEAALQKPIVEIFSYLDLSSSASASLAQVHQGALLDGTRVAVKVLRPGIEQQVYREIELLYCLARWVERLWPRKKDQLKPKQIVAQFEKHLLEELNLLQEAANASCLRRNFLHSSLLKVPEIFWDYSSERVLVTEWIEGVRIDRVDLLKASGVNLKRLAEHGVEIFFTQVLRDGFFHADMHPGNVFVIWIDPNWPQYAAVDFGIMGSLGEKDQRYLADNLLAFFKRDYHRVARLHVECGWVPPDTCLQSFESAMRMVCEPIFAKPLRDISYGQLLLRLLQIAARFRMEVQPQLLLLQKTLLNVEGLGRQLYPDLDIWQTAMPVVEKWVQERYKGKGLLDRLKKIGQMLFD